LGRSFVLNGKFRLKSRSKTFQYVVGSDLVSWIYLRSPRSFVCNLFCSEYLFTCSNSSEPVSATAFAERHLAAPLRDETGVAVVVVDMNLGETEAPDAFESRQIGHMMKLLTAATAEIIADSQDGRRVACIGEYFQSVC